MSRTQKSPQIDSIYGLDNSLSSKTKNNLIIGTVAFVTGFIIFILVTTTVYIPEKENLENTEKKVCFIEDFEISSSSCHHFSNCNCGCSLESCSTFLSRQENGICCRDSCCVRRECRSCIRQRCSTRERRTTCTPYVDSCCSRVCVETSTEACRVDWGQCYTVTITFRLTFQFLERSLVRNCGFNDTECVERLEEEFQVGEEKTCYHNTINDSVSFSKPSESKYRGSLVGICISVPIMFFACLVCFHPLFNSFKSRVQDRQRRKIEIVVEK